MDDSKSKSILLLIYSDPLHFPPTINAANILAEKGNKVYLVGYENTDNWSQVLNSSVFFESLGYPKKRLYSVVAFIKSIFFLRKFLQKHKIVWLISYDAKSVLPSFIATLFTKTKWIYHQHDFWEHPHGLWEKFIWTTERKLTRYANHVSFPQAQRALIFKKIASLKREPIIVFNGPRKGWLELVADESKIIKEYRQKFSYLLIYQGGWSKYFVLERLFDAIALCKLNVGLILLGEEREKGVRDYYIQYLQNLGISDRVFLASKYIPYEELPGYTKYCDLAIAKLTGDSDEAPFNDRYLIGAANKITEYIACGLPIILQQSEPNRLFLERYPIAIMTNTNDKIAFANTIDEILLNEVKRKDMAQKNKEIFRNELNFDDQFDKIINVINPE